MCTIFSSLRVPLSFFSSPYILLTFYFKIFSFNQPKSDIVRNAKIIMETAFEVVRSPNKSKEDVSAIYHRLADTFEWSNSSGESADDDDDEEDGPSRRRR